VSFDPEDLDERGWVHFEEVFGVVVKHYRCGLGWMVACIGNLPGRRLRIRDKSHTADAIGVVHGPAKCSEHRAGQGPHFRVEGSGLVAQTPFVTEDFLSAEVTDDCCTCALLEVVKPIGAICENCQCVWMLEGVAHCDIV
jgi:hypothetical protein